jgi:hypothetical protein
LANKKQNKTYPFQTAEPTAASAALQLPPLPYKKQKNNKTLTNPNTVKKGTLRKNFYQGIGKKIPK